MDENEQRETTPSIGHQFVQCRTALTMELGQVRQGQRGLSYLVYIEVFIQKGTCQYGSQLNATKNIYFFKVKQFHINILCIPILTKT